MQCAVEYSVAKGGGRSFVQQGSKREKAFKTQAVHTVHVPFFKKILYQFEKIKQNSKNTSKSKSLGLKVSSSFNQEDKNSKSNFSSVQGC